MIRSRLRELQGSFAYIGFLFAESLTIFVFHASHIHTRSQQEMIYKDTTHHIAQILRHIVLIMSWFRAHSVYVDASLSLSLPLTLSLSLSQTQTHINYLSDNIPYADQVEDWKPVNKFNQTSFVTERSNSGFCSFLPSVYSFPPVSITGALHDQHSLIQHSSQGN